MNMKNFCRLVAALLLAVAASGWAAPAPAVPSRPVPALSIALAADGDGNLVSLRAHQVPVRTVLTALAARAGFALTEGRPLTQPVSLECRRAPLEVALRHLLEEERASFMVVYSPQGPHKLQHVVVLHANPAVKGHSRRPGLGQAPRPQAPCVWLTAETAPAPPVRVATGVAAGPPFEAEVETSLDALLAASTSADVAVQTSALEALASAHPTEARARQAVLAALGAPDPAVRAVLVGTLGPLLPQWPEAEGLLMRALSDPEPEVRRRALSVLRAKAPWRSNDILHIALHDPDPALRRQAQDLLRDLAPPGVDEQEGGER